MTHTWLDSSHNDCCSCGWRCAFNGSGTHMAGRCKMAHGRHVEREAPKDLLADFIALCGHENDHFLEGEQGTDIEDSVERNQQ